MDFIRNLKASAEAGIFNDVVGREDELETIVIQLKQSVKPNVLLLGGAGAGKTAIVEALALRIADGRIGETFEIVELIMEQFVGGTKWRGDLEERVNQLKQYLTQNPKVVLFVDEVHMLMSAGKTSGGDNLAQWFKADMERGRIRIIGATTNSEYEQWIKPDQALERRFKTIELKPLSDESLLKIIERVASKESALASVEISPEIFPLVLEEAKRKYPQRADPDRSLDVLRHFISEAAISFSGGTRSGNSLSLAESIKALEKICSVLSSDDNKKLNQMCREILGIEKEGSVLAGVEFKSYLSKQVKL